MSIHHVYVRCYGVGTQLTLFNDDRSEILYLRWPARLQVRTLLLLWKYIQVLRYTYGLFVSSALRIDELNKEPNVHSSHVHQILWCWYSVDFV
jgi:hypothetical protein